MRAVGAGRTLIAVDGATGVGKTTISRSLAGALGCGVVHLDEFLATDPTRTYVDRLPLDRIRGAIGDARPVIVDGICVLQVLDRLSLKPDYHVYVKKVNSHGFWGDELMCDLGRIQEGDELGWPDGLSRLDSEIKAYHRTYDPHGRADVIYQRTLEY